MVQKKGISYLLPPMHVVSHFASLLRDMHSSLEHLISSKNFAFEAGLDPDDAVGTPTCLEEFH